MINTQQIVQGPIQPVSAQNLQGGYPAEISLSRPLINTLPPAPASIQAPKLQYLSANLDPASKIVGTDIDQYIWGGNNNQPQQTETIKNEQVNNQQPVNQNVETQQANVKTD